MLAYLRSARDYGVGMEDLRCPGEFMGITEQLILERLGSQVLDQV
jgi:hypothetical protein